MGGFADLVDPVDAAPAPAPKKSRTFADFVDPPSAAPAQSSNAPTFNVKGDPAAARAQIAAIADPKERAALLTAFDQQVTNNPAAAGPGRGLTPASAYFPQPQEPAAPGGPVPVPLDQQGPKVDNSPSLGQRAWAATQAGVNTVAGAVGGAAGTVYGGLEGLGEGIGQGKSPMDIARNMDARAQQRAQQFTPELPQGMQTQLGKDYTGNVADFIATNAPAVAPLAGEIGAMARPATQFVGDAGKAQVQAIRDTFAKREAAAAPRVEPVVPPAPTPGAPAAPAAAAPVTAKATAAAAPATPPQASVDRISLNLGQPEKAFEDLPANGAKPLPLPDQQQRAQVLQSVGLDTARKSSLAADGLGAATDAQTAKLDSPAGAAMKAQLEHEKSTLNNYADTLVRDTGGTTTADQTADYARGANITGALDGIKGWYDNHISTLYKTADERAQGVPTSLDKFRTVLGDDSQMTNSDRVHLRGAVQAYAKKLGIIGDDGTVFANAQQAETMRKYLGENWTPQNGRFVGALKDALDDGVTQAAGEDVYAAARQMRADRGRTLDNPNGIAKIMDSSGPNGINRSVATEKIPTAIASMPVDQFSHIVDTLKSAPAEVQPQAQTAISEIKAHFANQVRNIGNSQAGQYNAKGVGNYLRSNAARMNAVFEPEEMQSFSNLHQAAQILAKDQSYPGAAVQGHNLIRSGAMKGVQGAFTAAGAALGGPAGAAAGSLVGGKAAEAIGERGSLKAVQGRMTRIADFPQ